MGIVLIKKGVKGTGSLVPPTSERPATALSPIINNPAVKIVSPSVPLISRDEMTDALVERAKDVVMSGPIAIPKQPFPSQVKDFDPGPAPAYNDTWTYNGQYSYDVVVGGSESVDAPLIYPWNQTTRWTHPALFDQGNITTTVTDSTGKVYGTTSGVPDSGLLLNGVLKSTGKSVASIRLTPGSTTAYYDKVFKVQFKRQSDGVVLVTAYFKHPTK